MTPHRRRLGIAAFVVVAAAGLAAEPASTVAAGGAHRVSLLPVTGSDGEPVMDGGLAVWQMPGTRYRFEAGGVRLISGLLLHSSAAEPPPTPVLQAPRELAPGAPLRVYLAAEEWVAQVTVSVRSGDRELVSGRAFPVAAGGRAPVWAAVLGIPSTASPGATRLLVTGRSGAARRGMVQVVQPLTIARRSFAAEEIPLSAELTNMRRTPDPRRVEQSRELWRLLTSWRPVAGGHLARLRPPVIGARRSAGFGDRRQYRYDDDSVDQSVHNGVDFAAPEGTVVVAAGAGTVVMAQFRIITGLSVVIEHLPGVYSLYYHLARLNVAVGQRVAAGMALGAVGSTGLATGPHLHWEVRAAGVAVDPDVLVTTPLVDIPDELATLFP